MFNKKNQIREPKIICAFAAGLVCGIFKNGRVLRTYKSMGDMLECAEISTGRDFVMEINAGDGNLMINFLQNGESHCFYGASGHEVANLASSERLIKNMKQKLIEKLVTAGYLREINKAPDDEEMYSIATPTKNGDVYIRNVTDGGTFCFGGNGPTPVKSSDLAAVIGDAIDNPTGIDLVPYKSSGGFAFYIGRMKDAP